MKEWLITNSIAVWLLPPACLLLTAGWGLWRLRRHPRSGKALLALSLVTLWALSTPWLARALLQSLEPAHADPLRSLPAQAIVVLGAGKYHAAPEYGGMTTVSELSLTRLRYAAYLHRRTGKPILVSGGSPEGASVSEAKVMKDVLENEFHTPVTWAESVSNTTFENARDSRAMLAPLGINRIYLVTHAFHMRRAQSVFTAAGFEVVPAPTRFTTVFRLTLLDFIPQAGALRNSAFAFHEIIGLAWYWLKSMVHR